MTKPILVAIAMILLELSAVRAGEGRLSLAKGETRTIEFVENPSTGYVWRFDREASENPAIVRVGDGGFTPAGDAPDRALVGAPGRRFFRIEAVTAGRARLVFVEERPWEKRAVQRRTIEIQAR
ncbi:protease inhibitor I42 family protein [Methylosinus sp. LW3]|uniref:protease inhibitor I42 family protein n=1 Tax=Methylosinus sp. LW3 TaxID=107635 RepID=UPI000465FD34|nr:protease inhibitor I42 family protein [Methylosinus sp. LW3]